MKPLKLILASFLLAPVFCNAWHQPDTINSGNEQVLNIYLDCASCDMEYFKTNFTAVNYVCDSHDADVHILVSSLPTGGGGEEYTIRYAGAGKYSSLTDTVLATLPEHFTFDETRRALLEKIQLGLVPYLLKTPYGSKLALFIDESPIRQEEKDPWKSWVFDISCAGSLSGQKYAKSYSLFGSLYISKITREIKIESASYFNFSESSFGYYEEDTLATYYASQQEIQSQNLFVRSLGDHWGIGGFGSFGRSEYSNLDFQLRTGPAAEYNIFSYEEAATHECRILYSIMYEHSDYNVMTVYGKMKDDLFTQNLSIIYTNYQPWGTVSASAGGSAYLNDLSQFSTGASASASLKVSRGFSVSLSGSIGYCQNQRSLREGVGDLPDILGGQWEMEQGLTYSLSAGISFRFGSKNNNAVNPRFG